MKTIQQIALTTLAALTVAAGLSAAQTTPSTSTIVPSLLTPSSIAKTTATSVSDAIQSAEQKAVISAQEKVAAGEQKVTTVKQKATQLRQRYLGYLSQIPKASRAKYQTIATNSGYEKAITAIKTALGK